MSTSVHKISRNMIEEIERRQGHICSICGKDFGSTYTGRGHIWTVDHIIPQSIYKWLKFSNLLTEEELKDLHSKTTCIENLTFACEPCNMSKDSTIVDDNYILDLKIPIELKYGIMNNLDECSYYIEVYKEYKKTLCDRQDCECKICGKKINYESSVIRRINWDLPRTSDNAMVVCRKCNSSESILGGTHSHKKFVRSMLRY